MTTDDLTLPLMNYDLMTTDDLRGMQWLTNLPLKNDHHMTTDDLRGMLWLTNRQAAAHANQPSPSQTLDDWY